MSFTKGSRKKTILTIIIAAVLISAAMAGGKWGVGFADATVPTVISIIPDKVHVNSVTIGENGIPPAIISGGDFSGILYTKVFFQEPEGAIYEFSPEGVDGCDIEGYHCTSLTVILPNYLFLNWGIAEIWVENYDENGAVTGTSTNHLYMAIIDELYLPIIMKNN